jgi:hypothetical protein
MADSRRLITSTTALYAVDEANHPAQFRFAPLFPALPCECTLAARPSRSGVTKAGDGCNDCHMQQTR